MMHPGDDELYGPSDAELEVIRIIDNYYTCFHVLQAGFGHPLLPSSGEAEFAKYVEQGLADLDSYLAKHAAFGEFMSERSENNA